MTDRQARFLIEILEGVRKVLGWIALGIFLDLALKIILTFVGGA